VVVYSVPRTIAGEWAGLVGSPIPIEKILAKFKVSVENVRVKVEELEAKPPKVKDLPPGRVVAHYLKLTLEGVKPEDVLVGHITFKVSKEWLKANDILKWSILLHRFDEGLGEWITSPTKRIKEDAQFVYYTTVVPRFSVLAITGAKELPPIEFEVKNLSITPGQVEAGKEVKIGAEVINLSQREATYMAILWLNGLVEASKQIALAPGEKGVVSFTVVKPEGSYEVMIERLFGSFKVIPPVPPAPPTVPQKLAMTPPSPSKVNTPTFRWEVPEKIPAGLDYYEVSIDKAPFINIGVVTTYKTPVLTDGKHTFEVRVVDKMGQKSPLASLTFLIDTTPPTTPTNIKMITPDTDLTPTFTWQAATDEVSGVNYYEVSIDDAPYINIGKVTEYTQPTELSLGDHIFRVRAVDKAGNIGKPGSLRFTLVAPPPPPPPPIPIWWWVIIAILVLGVAAVVVYRLRRR